MNEPCWCCGKGREAHDSRFLCQACVDHGASRFPAPVGEWKQSPRDPREKD